MLKYILVFSMLLSNSLANVSEQEEILSLLETFWEESVAEVGTKPTVEILNFAAVKSYGVLCDGNPIYGVRLYDLNPMISGPLSELEQQMAKHHFNGGSGGGVFLIFTVESGQLNILFEDVLLDVESVGKQENCPLIKAKVHHSLKSNGILKYVNGRYQLLRNDE